jgi:hypothetical protein
MKRSDAKRPDDLELQRLNDISQWARTEQWELCFRAGYWARNAASRNRMRGKRQ